MVRVNMILTGKHIKRLRCEKGYSVIKLAEKLSVSTQVIYDWQNGKCIPNIDNLAMLADIFGVKIDDILVKESVQII